MQRNRRLPARQVALPGESLASLLRRTSEGMGYKDVGYIANLISDKRAVLWNANSLCDDQLLTPLGQLLDCSPWELLSLTVHRWSTELVLPTRRDPATRILDTETTLRYFTAAATVCPGCLRDDRVPYERVAWLFQPAPICPEHRCLLVDRCSDCQRQLRPNRKLVQNCSCGSDIRQWRACKVSEEAARMARSVFQCLHGVEEPIPGLSTATCFWWLDRIRACLDGRRKYLADWPNALTLPPAATDEQSTWFAATSTISDWPNRFLSFLDVLQQNSESPQSSAIARTFGYLPRNASKLEALGYAAPADVLRDYLLTHYTRGHLSRKVCLFKSRVARSKLSCRDWITQTQGARLLGVRHTAIRELIERGLLEGKWSDAGTRTVGLVRRASVGQLKQQLRESLSRTQAASRLGIGPHQLVDLIRLDLLCGIRTQRGWRVLLGSVQSLENRYRELPCASRLTSNWLSARQATRVYGPTGLTFARLWQSVVTGQIRGCRLHDEGTLKGVLVSKRDLDHILPDIRAQHFGEHGYPLNHLAKVLLPGRPTKERVLKKWIAMRMLCVRRSGRSRVCSQEEVDRFRATYCHAAEVCELLHISRASLVRWEAEGRIQPVYGKRVTPGAGFSLYRRDDVTQIKQQRETGTFRRVA